VNRSAALRVGLYGLVSLFLYALLMGVVPGLQTAEPTFAGEVITGVAVLSGDALGQDHLAAARPFTFILVALFALYGLALRDVSGATSRVMAWVVFAAGTAFLVIQVFGPVMYSQDPYAYATYGREVAVYGGDPYADEALIAEADPLLSHWTTGYVPSRYGPVWTLISTGIAMVAGEHVGLTLLLYRGVAIIAALAAGFVVYRSLLRLAPARAVAGAAFFLWNPLVVLEAGANAHNDVLLAAFLMLAFLLVLRGNRVLSMVPLVLAALVKVIALAAVPLFLAFLLRRLTTWKERGLMLARCAVFPMMAAGALLTWYPGSMRSVIDAGTSASSYTNSLHELAFERLRVVLGDAPEMARVPVYFVGWWLKSTKATALRAQDEGGGALIETAAPGTAFLVRAPQMTDWAFVVNATTHNSGYVNTADTEETERPSTVDSDPVLVRFEGGPSASLAVSRTNLLLRVFSYVGFCGVWLCAAWRCTTPRQLAVGVTAVFLASYWILLGWFWPWYLLWALAPAALVLDGRAAWLTALLSASVLSLYALTGAGEWAYHYRALAMFVPPLLLFPMYYPPALARRIG